MSVELHLAPIEVADVGTQSGIEFLVGEGYTGQVDSLSEYLLLDEMPSDVPTLGVSPPWPILVSS